MKTFFSKFDLLICVFFVLTQNTGAHNLFINEVMSSNVASIYDEEGDTNDWFELFNASTTVINLSGYSVTDKSDKSKLWTLPDFDLSPGGHIFVFASGKDKKTIQNWQLLVRSNDIWKYFPGAANPPANWNTNSFNPQSWASGPGGFGFGDDDDETEFSSLASLYIRTSFNLENIDEISNAALFVDYDDAFVAYLNGVEIARANIDGNPPAFNATALDNHEAMIYQGGSPDRFDLAGIGSLLVNGENILAIQGHNVNSTSSDFSLIPYFAVSGEKLNSIGQEIPDFLNLKSSFLHTDFKLSASGEMLYLLEPGGAVIDSVNTGLIPADVTLGRYPDGGNWALLANPTPGAANSGNIFKSSCPDVELSSAPGFYSTEFKLELTCPLADARIYYTLDGSDPDSTDNLYKASISITKTMVVRARAFNNSFLPGKIVTGTYLLRENITLPVVSLATDPFNLWDEDYGIYVKGKNAESNDPYFGANFWMDWERPVHIEFFDNDEASGTFSLDGGMKIYGAWSRARDQKSLALFARKKYGTESIHYRIFPERDVDEYTSFLIRNSGNDWPYTMMRDGILQELVRTEMDIETLAFRPAVLFLNGEYWGILNLREKPNEEYLAANKKIDPDEVDILEYGARGPIVAVVEGSADEFNKLTNFITMNNMALESSWKHMNTLMDMDSYIEYMCAQIYYDNTDWPSNNIKFWRPRADGGKWRWIMFDTDFGFGLYGAGNYRNNTLTFAASKNGPDWPNPPYSTLLFRKLLENKFFQVMFINIFCDHLNTTFLPERVIDLIDAYAYIVEPEIPRHQDRWPGSASSWEYNVDVMRDFAEQRPPYIMDYIRSFFNLRGSFGLTLKTSGAPGAKIKVNTRILNQFPWYGEYFLDIPVTLTALPPAGYKFTGWSPATPGNTVTMVYDSKTAKTITANFEPVSSTDDILIINEINYNSSKTLNSSDWVELYNPADYSVPLEGWRFKDSDDLHEFVFSNSAFIPAKGYFVLCRDSLDFKKAYAPLYNYCGNLEFDLSNAGDALRLFNPAGVLVDTLVYMDDLPWPENADGTGFTIELKQPELDNTNPVNWVVSPGRGGSPGHPNSFILGVNYTEKSVTSFQLLQNYPNPFNASTTIEYQLPVNARVRITVYDVTGRLVTRLVDRAEESGVHRLVWQGSVSSGIYFFTLEATGNNSHFKEMRKMLLIK